MISLKVNDTERPVEAEPETPLLWALRNDLGLNGTKFGCGMALCGACTVHVDGKPVRSCVTPVGSVKDAEVTTIEGVAGKEAEAVWEAWVALDVTQCGYCQPGQVMAAVALLRSKAAPTDAEIDGAMSGNICRCGTYPRIRAAIHRAAGKLAGGT